MAKQKLSKAEKKQKRKEQRQEDALRSYRFRGLKNFLFWLSGMLTCLILIVSALFVGLKVIPIGTYLGSSANGYVSKDVSSKSIIDAFLKANTYDMSDFPVVADALDELIKGANLDEYVEIDVERIKTLKFDGDFATELQSCVKVVATLDSVGGADLLRDIGKLDVFSTWAEVDADNMPIDEDSDGVIDKDGGGEFLSNPKLYYYLKTTELALLAAKMSSVGEYVRAFDDNGRYVDGYNGQPLVFANLSKVPILDVVDLIDESFGRLKLTNLLETFGGADLDSSMIGNILGDKTISQMGNITGDSILIKDFLGEPTPENQQMYDILCAIVKTDGEEKPLPEELSLGHLQGGIDFEGIKIDTFGLDESTIKILFDAVNGKLEATGETLLTDVSELAVSHLTSLDPNYIKLSSVLPYKDAEEGIDNSEMYKIILQACGYVLAGLEDADVEVLANELSINSFNNIDFFNISIDTFGLDESTIKILFDAVNGKLQATGETLLTDLSELTVSHLTSLDPNYIKLSSVLPYKDAEEGIDNSYMYRILLQACGYVLAGLEDADVEELANDLAINSFNNLDFDNISIETFGLDESTIKILFDAVNGKIEADNEKIDKGELTGEKKTPLENTTELTVEHLTSLDPNYITLSSVLPYKDAENGIDNSYMYKIILQACGYTLVGLEDADVEELASKLAINSFNEIDFNNVSVETFGLDESTLTLLLDAVNGKLEEEGEETLSSTAELTVEHLTSLDPNYITLSSILPYKDAEKGVDNSQLYKIILQACGHNIASLDDSEIEELASGLGINAFSDFNEQNITLNTILPVDATDDDGNYVNKSLYDILLDMVNSGKTGADRIEATEITLSDLSSFKTDSIRLSTILPLTQEVDGEIIDANRDLYNILSDVVNAPGATTIIAKEDITIAHLSNFVYSNIRLNTVLKIESNGALYDILNDIINQGKTSGQEGYVAKTDFTIASLSSFDYSKIRLNTVMPNTPKNQALYDILLDVINGEDGTLTAEDITISHLSTFNNFDHVKLSTVLPYEKDNGSGVVPANTALYSILLDVINGDKEVGDEGYVTKAQIKLSDLSSFEFNNIKLSTVMPNTLDNQALYDILLDVINGEDGTLTAEEITISHLSTFNNFDHVKLSTVLPYQKDNGSGIMVDANTALYSILLDVINGDKEVGDEGYVTKDKIKLSHLSSFEFSSIKLSTVMPKTDTNQGLYKILLDVVSSDGVSVSEEQLNVGHLSSFDYNKMHLSTILPVEDNGDLYKVLLDVVNGDKALGSEGYVTEAGITLTHLGQFDVSKLHLKTVMPSSSNTILSKLIENNVKVGDLGTAIDGLSLYEIYGQNCFVEVSGETTKGRYKKQGDAYILDAEGEYVVSDDAGIWLFLCFETNEIETTNASQKGCAKKYTISNATLSALSDPESGSSISSKITNATIKQLYEAGILDSALPQLYAMSLQDVANGGILLG